MITHHYVGAHGGYHQKRVEQANKARRGPVRAGVEAERRMGVARMIERGGG